MNSHIYWIIRDIKTRCIQDIITTRDYKLLRDDCVQIPCIPPLRIDKLNPKHNLTEWEVREFINRIRWIT